MYIKIGVVTVDSDDDLDAEVKGTDDVNEDDGNEDEDDEDPE